MVQILASCAILSNFVIKEPRNNFLTNIKNNLKSIQWESIKHYKKRLINLWYQLIITSKGIVSDLLVEEVRKFLPFISIEISHKLNNGIIFNHFIDFYLFFIFYYLISIK